LLHSGNPHHLARNCLIRKQSKRLAQTTCGNSSRIISGKGDKSGNVILVNFWATWCAPCVKEIPEIVKLQEKYKERGLRVIAVSMDEPEELETNVRPFVAKRFPGFVSYLCKESDHDKFASVIDPAWNEIMPTNFLIDRTGKLRATLTGGKSYEEFEAVIAPLLP
jgi:thiol-disulfide isomerase/thioredoxin